MPLEPEEEFFDEPARLVRPRRRLEPRRRIRRHGRRAFAVLPTLLTLGNAACGFGAIAFAAKLGPVDFSPVASDLESLWKSAGLIFLAMLFDALDGRAARWTKQSSEFGAQLDSLCDAVSFGVAPAFLMLQFVQNFESPTVPPFQFHPRLLWVIAVLFVVCAILRLARFNVETDDEDTHDIFSGLPSPAAAGAVASFPLAIGDLVALADESGAQGQSVAEFLVPAVQCVLPIVTLAVACLMVSRIRFPHVFNQWFSGRRSRRHVIQMIFGLAIIFLLREMAVPVLFCYFAFLSPLRAAWDAPRRRLGKRKESAHTE